MSASSGHILSSAPGGGGGGARRRTIAVLVDWLKDGYQNLVFAGMADAAREADVNLLCLAGGVVGSPRRFGSQRNLIYSLAHQETVDGVLVLSGTLGNHLGAVELSRFFERFVPLPLVSVAIPIPGISTVVVEDAEGMRNAVRHLTSVHGQRNIAFIRGPEVNEEAERRFKAYREALQEAQIPFDERLVVPGDFQFESGVEAVRVLLDDRAASFEALVAVNDHMVMGALQELCRRGIQVPDQVALIGFDDVDEARFANPPLTTVRQPLYQQGAQALQLLLDQMNGRSSAVSPSISRMKTELIIRESCGCPGPAGDGEADQALGRVSGAVDSFDEALSSMRTEVCRRMVQAIAGNARVLPAGWDGQLLDAWAADLVAARPSQFVAALESQVSRAVDADIDASCWHGVVSAMRRTLLSLLAGDDARRSVAENLWHHGRERIGTLSERGQARQRLRADSWARVLSETSEALLSTVDNTSLVDVLVEKLPRCGIPSAYLRLFEEGPQPPTHATTLLAYDEGNPHREVATEGGDPLWKLLPEQLRGRPHRWTAVVEPLYVAAQQLGYVVFEMGPREGIIYESLREQISSAVNRVRLLQQLLAEADRRLQGQKLEAIGTLAAGVAHELNTPIQYVGNGITFLKEALASYQRALAGYRELLTKSAGGGTGGATAATTTDIEAAATALEQAEDLEYLATEVPRACIRTAEGIQRVSVIVNAMKEFARADSRAPSYADLNRGLLSTLEVARNEYKDFADIELQLGDLPPVHCFIGELNQVFLNLIVNAAHAIEDRVKGTGTRGAITVRSFCVAPDATGPGAARTLVTVEIKDTGGGIPAAIQDKVFDPFFTTKPVGRGSGQGLAIARSTVVGRHGGSLTFDSREGVGTVFRICLPVSGAAKGASIDPPGA